MTTIKLTATQVRKAVKATVGDIIRRYSETPDIDRNDVLDQMHDDCNSLWGSLVKHRRIDEYTAEDLVQTASACATIIQVAEEDSWVEDDRGLWEGLTFGVLASIAYFSLEHLIYDGLAKAGHDTNDERPFAKK